MLEVCKIARSSHSSIYKVVYSQAIDLTLASAHNIHYLHAIKKQISDCTLSGNKGYLSAKVQLTLFESVSTNLDTPKKNEPKRVQASVQNL